MFQVYFTQEGKGWGLRTLQDLPKGTFVCEYIGEILTNTELYDRNETSSSERHTYPVTLDADWGSEKDLKDDDALCLDATISGNVARFINHRYQLLWKWHSGIMLCCFHSYVECLWFL